MGVDIATFRARIGSFVPKKKATSPEHVKLLRLPVRTMFGFARLLTIATVMFILLASAGDVETNPGPTNAEKIDNLQHAIEALIAATNKNQQETYISNQQRHCRSRNPGLKSRRPSKRNPENSGKLKRD